MLWPKVRISVSTICRQRSCAPRSVFGRNTWPTAIGPGRSLSPPRAMAAAKKSCGISTWMPAPSPVFPAAAAAGDGAGEEVLRDFDMDAGAVAGLAVGVDGAAMPHRL